MQQGRPMIIFNGELDRIRGGYFPGLLYPSIARLEREFVPNATAAYYIHNFKGRRPGEDFQLWDTRSFSKTDHQHSHHCLLTIPLLRDAEIRLTLLFLRQA